MKPVSKPVLFAFSFWLFTTLMYGCGAKKTQPVVVNIPQNSPDPVLVQLDDAWKQVFPSESVRLGNAAKFQAPSAVYVVSGEAQCWDGSSFYPCNGADKILRARLHIGDELCEYQADNSADVVLSLRDCSQDYSQPTMLEKDTVIELENYDAPGQLLEVKFFLTN